MIAFLVLVLLLVALGAGFLAGAWVIDDYYEGERQRLQRRNEALETQWAGLQATQRMGVAYWQAQQALRAEAERQASGTVTPEQEG